MIEFDFRKKKNIGGSFGYFIINMHFLYIFLISLYKNIALPEH